MILQGSFRVIDSWHGVSKADASPRASVTLSDAVDGGQVKVNFSDGKIPPQFLPDALVSNVQVKANLTKFGLMLNFLGVASKGK